MPITPENDLGFTQTHCGCYRRGLCSTHLLLNSFTSSRKGPHICLVLGTQWCDSPFQGGFQLFFKKNHPEILKQKPFSPFCSTFPKALLHKYLKMSLFLCCNLQAWGSQTDAPPLRWWHQINCWKDQQGGRRRECELLSGSEQPKTKFRALICFSCLF